MNTFPESSQGAPDGDQDTAQDNAGGAVAACHDPPPALESTPMPSPSQRRASIFVEDPCHPGKWKIVDFWGLSSQVLPKRRPDEESWADFLLPPPLLEYLRLNLREWIGRGFEPEELEIWVNLPGRYALAAACLSQRQAEILSPQRPLGLRLHVLKAQSGPPLHEVGPAPDAICRYAQNLLPGLRWLVNDEATGIVGAPRRVPGGGDTFRASVFLGSEGITADLSKVPGGTLRRATYRDLSPVSLAAAIGWAGREALAANMWATPP